MHIQGSAARLLLAAALVIAIGACRSRTPSYAESLRCGMTREEVTRLAREHGYAGSDRNWLARVTGRKPAKDLRFMDLTFRAGRLVAYREAVYDARTKKTAYRTIELCK